MVLLPNLIFFRTKPNNPPGQSEQKENTILSAVEGIGRIGVFILPVFFAIHIEETYEVIALLGMIISLAFYYAGWIRYFKNNREYSLLFSPMAGIPVPLAVSPIVFFLFAAIILRSPYLFVAAAILAIGHIPVSLKQYNLK